MSLSSKQAVFLAKHGWVRYGELDNYRTGVWYQKVGGVNRYCDTGGVATEDRALLLQSCSNMDNWYWKKKFSSADMQFPSWAW